MGFTDTLANVGAFTSGAGQGFGQGLDLAAKYQDIQDKNAARAKRKSLEDFVSQEVERGGFEDPIKGLRATKDFAIQNNMIDEAIKYGQTADELEKSGKQKDGLALFQAVETNPIGSVTIYNDFAKKYGLQAMGPVRLGTDGKSIIATESSGATGTPIERTFATPDEFKGHILNAAASMMGFDDAASIMQFQQEGKKAEADIAQAEAAAGANVAQAGKWQAETMTEGLTRDAQLAQIEAGTAAQGASTQASLAAAGKYGAEAAAIGPAAQRDAEAHAANLALTKAKTTRELEGPVPTPKTVDEIVQARYKDVLPTDADGLIWPMGASPQEMTVIANGMVGAEKDPDGVADTAALLAGSPVEALGFDQATNTVYGPNGQAVPMTPAAYQTLVQAKARAMTATP